MLYPTAFHWHQFAQPMLFLAVFVFFTSACVTIQPNATHAPTSPDLSSATSPAFEPTGARAQSKPQLASAMQSEPTFPAEELLTSHASTIATDIKKEKLTQQLVQLKHQLERQQATQTAQTTTSLNQRPTDRSSLPAKWLSQRLVQKTSRLAQANSVNHTTATQASSANAVLLGLLLAAVGLLLVLLSSGTGVTVGIILLVVGLVVALVTLLN